jgi:peptide/nickel transport system substrate-binding protein
MAPVRGGTLTYLLEGETDTWDIPGANCAVACITILRNVTEPLMVTNDQNLPEPYLLESLEANDDFTQYVLKIRPGITFHDGTPLDGAAVQRNLIEMAKGILQGQVLMDLVGAPTDPAQGVVLTDPMTVTVTFTKPFSAFPYTMAERTGYVQAPSFWDDPNRASALAVGTGPFKMVEWTIDEQTVLQANPDYWRKDANGEQLPYLDEIVFRPQPDVAGRRATMEAGDADVNMDDFGENNEFWNTTWLDEGGGIVPPAPDREVGYLMFNNSVPPFDNPDMRKALALCTDRDEYIAFRSPGSKIANGPFAEGSPGFIADTGFPQFDPDAGNALLDEIGRPDEILYGTTDVPSNLLTAEFFADMWSTNCGLNVNIDQFQQRELITKAISGSFEVLLWRNHGQGFPPIEEIWWHSRHAEGLALNFGRIKNPTIDGLLEQMQATDDLAVIDDLAKQVSQEFAAQVHNLWLDVTEWNNVYQGNVHNVGVLTLPSGNRAQTALAGRTWVAEAWKEA